MNFSLIINDHSQRHTLKKERIIWSINGNYMFNQNLEKQAAPICEIREICERLKNMALGDIDFSRE